jgi:ATP/maltotriose-dependent transcriptional regulator MalT
MTMYVPPWVPPMAVAKVSPPLHSGGPIRRTGLLERLAVLRDDVPLVLFTAPAGYGKTTVLSQWAAVGGRWFGWVTLSAADNDPVRLAGHLAHALHRLVPRDPAALRSLAAGNEARARLLPDLLALLHRHPLPAVLVLDDAHELHNIEALQLIRALALSAPPRFHVVIGSRVGLGLSPPDSELPRLEFGPDDLAFTDEEARQVLTGAGVVCSWQEVTALVRRTHGWPAAVHLSALASGAAPGEDMRIQLRAAWEGQNPRATDAGVRVTGQQHAVVARSSAPLARAGGYGWITGTPALTSAEMNVLEWMPTHLSLSEIGEELHLSRNTVKSQVAAVYRKLGCSNRTEVVARGRDLGLLEL